MLIDLERALLRALANDDPRRALEVERGSLTPPDRAFLDAIDEDGFVLASLLVRKLRFERICRGDEELSTWFDREPERFTEVFRRYTQEVPPKEYFPQQEAAAFRAYCVSNGNVNLGPSAASKEV